MAPVHNSQFNEWPHLIFLNFTICRWRVARLIQESPVKVSFPRVLPRLFHDSGSPVCHILIISAFASLQPRFPSTHLDFLDGHSFLRVDFELRKEL